MTTEGVEVAVLLLDKTQAYVDPCLIDVMSDPDLDQHFILKCKVKAKPKYKGSSTYQLTRV